MKIQGDHPNVWMATGKISGAFGRKSAKRTAEVAGILATLEALGQL